jgi:hypothetical protein
LNKSTRTTIALELVLTIPNFGRPPTAGGELWDQDGVGSSSLRCDIPKRSEVTRQMTVEIVQTRAQMLLQCFLDYIVNIM